MVRDKSDPGLRMIDVARRESIGSMTDVKTCNRVRTASDEEVQNSSSKVAEQGTQIEFNLVS